MVMAICIVGEVLITYLLIRLIFRDDKMYNEKHKE